MIIDEILDRKNGYPFDADRFKSYTLDEAKMFGFAYIKDAYDISCPQTREDKVKRALVRYTLDNDYPLHTISFVLSVDWT